MATVNPQLQLVVQSIFTVSSKALGARRSLPARADAIHR
jgi:hypothetical protein